MFHLNSSITPVEYLFKYSLLGDSGVGKTTMLKNLSGIKSGMGAWSFTLIKMSIQLVNKLETCNLQIWDVPPSCTFSRPQGWMNFKGAFGGILVMDGTNPGKIERIKLWIAEFFGNNNTKLCPIILLGNKNDLKAKTSWILTTDRVQAIIDSLQQEYPGLFIRYLETSGKIGYNIETALEILTREVLKSKNNHGPSYITQVQS